MVEKRQIKGRNKQLDPRVVGYALSNLSGEWSRRPRELTMAWKTIAITGSDQTQPDLDAACRACRAATAAKTTRFQSSKYSGGHVGRFFLLSYLGAGSGGTTSLKGVAIDFEG